MSQLEHEESPAARNVRPALGSNIASRRGGSKQNSSVLRVLESKSSAMTQQYSSRILETLIGFCYTNQLKDPDCGGEELYLRELIVISRAALYFEINALLDAALEKARTIMKWNIQFACTLLDATNPDEPHFLQIRESARRFIRLSRGRALIPVDGTAKGGGVLALRNVAHLRSLLEDPALQADEITLFRAIQIWTRARCSPETGKRKRDDTALEAGNTIKDLIDTIDFANIPPSQLLTIVAPSGLVPRNRLLDAYKKQAQTAETYNYFHESNRADRSHLKRIVVRGAGTPQANGCYVEDVALDGSRIYIKGGCWEGFEVPFIIIKKKTTEGDTHWLLVVDTAQGDIHVLYSSPCHRISETIPMDSWYICGDYAGEEPPPTATPCCLEPSWGFEKQTTKEARAVSDDDDEEMDEFPVEKDKHVFIVRDDNFEPESDISDSEDEVWRM